jgi:hypothetical protein
MQKLPSTLTRYAILVLCSAVGVGVGASVVTHDLVTAFRVGLLFAFAACVVIGATWLIAILLGSNKRSKVTLG